MRSVSGAATRATLASALLIFSMEPAPSAERHLPEQVEAAGIQLAIASICRAKYGEEDLFEAAFEQLKKAVIAHGGMSRAEIFEARQKMLEAATNRDENPLARGFCDMLREQLM